MNPESKSEIIRILKFVGFSLSAGIIELGTFTLLNEFSGLPYWPCYLTAQVVSVIWNFTLNRKFTFRSANNIPKAMLLVAIFYCVFTPLSTILGNFLAENLMWNEYVVTGLILLLNFTTEFLYDRFIVFRGSIDTNIKGKRNAVKKEM